MGGDDFAEAHDLFGAEPHYPEHALDRVVEQLTEAGFRVDESGAWKGTSRFHDVGALVYYFKLVPWDVPKDFCVDSYADALLRLHADGPGRGRPLSFTACRFWLRASKPVSMPAAVAPTGGKPAQRRFDSHQNAPSSWQGSANLKSPRMTTTKPRPGAASPTASTHSASECLVEWPHVRAEPTG